MDRRELICICCPMGCPLSVELNAGEVQSVSGNTCPRGEIYAKKEVTNPTRILTTTIPVEGGGMLPVKTSRDIPKDKLMVCLNEVKRITAGKPIEMGQVILENICGLGVDVVACGDME